MSNATLSKAAALDKDVNYIHLKNIFTSIYIDSYRNYLTQFNRFIELLFYNLMKEDVDKILVNHYVNDLLMEIEMNTPDLADYSSAFKWLAKQSKKGDFFILKHLTESILYENGHFLKANREQNVVLIDPKTVVLKYLNLVFKKHGFNTLRFQHPEQALIYFESIDPKIIAVVCDYDLHSIDGKQFVEKLNERSYHTSTPVIFIANYSDTRVIRESFGIGTVDYVKKPIQADVILSKVIALAK